MDPGFYEPCMASLKLGCGDLYSPNIISQNVPIEDGPHISFLHRMCRAEMKQQLLCSSHMLSLSTSLLLWYESTAGPATAPLSPEFTLNFSSSEIGI